MLKIGHRGAKGHAPENTIESFHKAFALGADGIELDVHLSADFEVVVLHDATVDRTIKNATGFVKDFTLAECKVLGIPSLLDVLEIVPPHQYVNIEIKDATAVTPVVQVIENWISNKVLQYSKIMVSSFDWSVLKEIRVLNDQILLGVLTEDSLEEACQFATTINAYSVNPYFKLLIPSLIQKAKQKGLKIHTWTVNLPEDITFVKKLGVDAIISDYPDRL